MFSNQRQQLYRSYPFHIAPATDNKPYFSQFLRLNRLADLSKLFYLRQLPFFEMGSFILALTLALLMILACLLIILPLFKLGRLGSGHFRTVIYFGGLGLGYMMIEIVFIQNFTLFLGHPIKAAATVITALLFFSGLGSLYSESISLRPTVSRTACSLAVLLVIMFALVIPRIVNLEISSSAALRTLFAVLAIAPIGFILGIPFPLGLRSLHQKQSSQVPWAFGINSCFSVIGPALATLTAVQFGFTAVFLLAGTAYFCALCCVPGDI